MRKTRIVKYSESADRRCKQRKVSGGRFVSLNDDVLTEILAWLPVKSVIRFKLVCKSWLSLFSSDQFRRLHTLRCHKPRPSLILATIDRKEKYYWEIIEKVTLYYSNPNINKLIPFDNTTIKNCKIWSCSNGLVLVECEDDYYVHNPVTKQSKKLRLANDDKFVLVMSLLIVFDPSKSPHYKIVCVRYDCKPDDGRYQIEVFNSGSETWRVCVEPFTSEEILSFNACVQIKSFIYLIHNYNNDYGRVYCFDIEKNVSRLIAIPVPSVDAYTHSIQESNCRLYYCALLGNSRDKLSAALWKLQVNGDDPRRSEWSFKCRHTLRLDDNLQCHRITYIGETCTMLIHTLRKIVAYNFRDKSYKEILDLESKISHVKFYKFGETLALL